MKKIDRETVQRILDAADIVEVVSDFVSLKKRGVNYIGLCPFHNERTPSFSVSRSKGICKCFSCGKGGSPVNFIMEHEQVSYYDALRYLAKKYNITIKERELSKEEQQQESERESMMAVNDFALDYFEHTLLDTQDGRDIGLAYFHERGISDVMIKKFRLGYSLDKGDALYKAATAKGFDEKYLIATGLCARSEKGSIYDRFCGRVIYPVFSISGRIVAFGGRTLRSDKTMAKYVNSPESIIYHKSRELYGMYQAKSAIAKKDKCILVEGYMDVISMHQAGVENVVASSGTSLTYEQIRLIHRFTPNVTVIYDSDAAGIKASLRGIDMLLAEGLNIKVLLLPDGDDPDSFAQSHSSAEVFDYIDKNETDFIRFKMDVLLKDAGDDPIKRSKVITDILKSISVIPDIVSRTLYLQECSRRLGIDEKVLSLQLTKLINENIDKEMRKQGSGGDQPAQQSVSEGSQTVPDSVQTAVAPPKPVQSKLQRHEHALLKYIVKYAFIPLAFDPDQPVDENFTVIAFVEQEFNADGIVLTDPTAHRIYELACETMHTVWPGDMQAAKQKFEMLREAFVKEEQHKIAQEATDLRDIEQRERKVMEIAEERYNKSMEDFNSHYLLDTLTSSPEDDVRKLATDLASEKYQLSKVHTKYSHIETEVERLPDLVFRSMLEVKLAILEEEINALNAEMKSGATPERTRELMQQIFDLYQLRAQFARELGERIVNPR